MKKSNFLCILFFIIVFLFILFTSFFTEFNFSDETWNFINIYKMYRGGTIYKDNNVIITPLFFLLGNLFFKLFGANLLVFRVYNSLIYFIKYILIYLIFRKLSANRTSSILYTMLFLTLDNRFISSGANYNTLACALSLIGINIYIKKYNHKVYHFYQGLIIFLLFFTKQTLGIYYAFGIIMFELTELGFGRKFLKNQLIKFSIFAPCLLFSLVIMVLKGNLYEFLNLCFGGILEFGNSNFTISLNCIPYLVAIIVIFIFSFIVIIKLKNVPEDIKKNITFLLCLSIAMFFNSLPIINLYHVNIAVLYAFILYFYTLHALMLKDFFNTKSILHVLMIISSLIIFILFAKLGYRYFSNVKSLENFDKTSIYYNAPVSLENVKRIDSITDYISKKQKDGIKVIVLSHEAGIYMSLLDINNVELDLLFSGNLGYNGTAKTIDKISNMKNTEFLIFTDKEDSHYQEASKIHEYIINNFEKSGEFLNYSIYINK